MSKLSGEFLADFFQTDSGSGNGSTTTFSASAKFVNANAIFVFVDGILRTDYTVNTTNNTITFTTAPANAQAIVIKYIKKSI